MTTLKGGLINDNSNKQHKAREKSRWVPVGVLVSPGRQQRIARTLHQVEGSLTSRGFSMVGQGLGERQARTIGGRRKASEIEKKHAIGVSPKEGSSTLGRQQ
jgi:hypothetical protein